MGLRELIFAAVSDAEREAESPCIFLSGGIDSSTVAELAPNLPAITGWYDHPGCDERAFAALAAGSREWIQVQITPADFVSSFEATQYALDGLLCGPGAVGQYVVARKAVEHGFRTVLTGEGGDELFGGYARQHIIAGLPRPEGYDDYDLPADYPTTLQGALEHEWVALRTLCSVDKRIAGAHGLRVVTPLLDPWVVAHVHAQPSQLRIGKTLLRDAMRGVVPDQILDRTDKRGFPVPFVAWAQYEPMRSFINDRIGYIPDPSKPWDRQWWYDMLAASDQQAAA